MTTTAYQLVHGFATGYLRSEGFSEAPHMEGSVVFMSDRDDLVVTLESIPTVPTRALIRLALNAGGIVFDESGKPKIWGSTPASMFMSRFEKLVEANDAELKILSAIADSKLDSLYRKIRLNYEVTTKK